VALVAEKLGFDVRVINGWVSNPEDAEDDSQSHTWLRVDGVLVGVAGAQFQRY
jgi:hypothetical protein